MGRIDAKIKRDKLFASCLEDFWQEFWSEIQSAVVKIKGHWNIEVSAKLNDDNSVIRLKAPVRSAENGVANIAPEAEIRLDRGEKRVIVRVISSSSKTSSYKITPDPAGEKLLFNDNSALQLAEIIVAEQLLAIDLS